MKSKIVLSLMCIGLLLFPGLINPAWGQSRLVINDQDYFEMPGFDVMVFDDYYPVGHQSGITIIQNGERVAANGDLRLNLYEVYSEKTEKKADKNTGTIRTEMSYRDIKFKYSVQVKAEGNKIIVTADLNQPLPENWIGKAWFQIDLFPALLFGKSWNMDDQTGIFPTDAFSPMVGEDVKPYARGKVLTVAPGNDV